MCGVAQRRTPSSLFPWYNAGHVDLDDIERPAEWDGVDEAEAGGVSREDEAGVAERPVPDALEEGKLLQQQCLPNNAQR